jgi:hypothetical protein
MIAATTDVTPAMESVRTATIKIRGVSALLYGSRVNINLFPKKNNESHDDYEKRTWRERCHATEDGRLFTPSFALKRMLATTAKSANERIPGKGMQTWGKKFRTGIMVPEHLILTPTTKKADVHGHWAFVPSDGKTGGGTRVDRCFPLVQEWGGEFQVILLEECIREDVVLKYAQDAGMNNGLGTWRPQSGGDYGRFKVEGISWDEQPFGG